MTSCEALSKMTRTQFVRWVESASDAQLEAALKCQALTDERKALIERELLQRQADADTDSSPSP